MMRATFAVLLLALVAGRGLAANELSTSVLDGGLTGYFLIIDCADGDMWNGSAFVTPTGTHDTFDIVATEHGGGVYRADLPAIPAGLYRWEFWVQAGGSPDKALDTQTWLSPERFWNGSAFGADVCAFGGVAGTFAAGRPEVDTSAASNEAISKRGIVIDNGIVDTVTSQTQFTIGSLDAAAAIQAGTTVYFYDVSATSRGSSRRVVSFDGVSLTIDSAPDFTVASGDDVRFFITPPHLQTIHTGVASIEASTWTPTERAQVLAALSIGEDIGVPSALVWTIVRIDGALKARAPVVKDSEEEAEVAADFRGVLAPGDAIDPENGIVSIELIDDAGEEAIDSPAFEDLEEAELWMNGAVRFRVIGGTVGDEDRVRVKVLTVGGNVHSVPCTVIISDGK